MSGLSEWNFIVPKRFLVGPFSSGLPLGPPTAPIDPAEETRSALSAPLGISWERDAPGLLGFGSAGFGFGFRLASLRIPAWIWATDFGWILASA